MYLLLTPEDCDNLRRERILVLEAEHFNAGLELAELDAVGADGDQARGKLRARVDELERRIELHNRGLTGHQRGADVAVRR